MVLIWASLAITISVPIAAAVASPLLAWRDPIYIVAGFAGIVAMTLMLVQPLLAAGYLPGLSRPRGRRIHLWIGGILVLAVVLHVAGLWITSPPDVIDALLFASPTPFSAWGVIAMWAVFVAAFIAMMRNRLNLQPRTWRRVHTTLTSIVIAGTITHAMLIEGTMETVSKSALCLLVVVAAVKALSDLKVWKLWRSP
ncbi:ferric reductase-like transmembrane domain-containing protein [Sulfitobacter mediterraneus]|uniref:ferric reductase-like transmembrane domain-containing protein n=1 Tax=Sulfitobacter mediterraneus TaxID=83219 RepID=UPI000EA22532|nr:ferric reductase-like transmembrane domain-containing protein [Sulfitobacter mediterraneus]